MNLPATQISILITIVFVALLLSSIRTNKTETFESLPNNTRLEQWDIRNLNEILSTNQFNPINPNNRDLLKKTIIYFSSKDIPHRIPESKQPPPPPPRDWTGPNDGTCVTDGVPRSIRNKDNNTDLLRMTTGEMYVTNNVNGGLVRYSRGGPRLNGGRFIWVRQGWWGRIVWQPGASHQQFYDTCKSWANSKNATVFGLQAGDWCLAGTTNDLALGKKGGGYAVKPKSDCNKFPFPNQNGNDWKNSVYTRTLRTIVPPLPRVFDKDKLTELLTRLREVDGYKDMKHLLDDKRDDDFMY